MLKKAKDVPMLDMYGGENWTPDVNHPGLFKRAGMNHWACLHMGSGREEQRFRRELRREQHVQLRQDRVRLGSRRAAALLSRVGRRGFETPTFG